MPEYAVGVALVALALILSIGWLRDASSDRYDDSIDMTYDAGSVTPTTSPGTTTVVPPTVPTTTTTTTTPPTTTTAPPSAVSASPANSGGYSNGFKNNGGPSNSWSARVTITLTGGSTGNQTITGTWSTGATGSCTTANNASSCTITLDPIPDATTSVTWTFTSISPGPGSGTPSATVSCPNPATCD